MTICQAIIKFTPNGVRSMGNTRNLMFGQSAGHDVGYSIVHPRYKRRVNINFAKAKIYIKDSNYFSVHISIGNNVILSHKQLFDRAF